MRETERDREIQRERERETETEIERETERGTERDRETERQRDREPIFAIAVSVLAFLSMFSCISWPLCSRQPLCSVPDGTCPTDLKAHPLETQCQRRSCIYVGQPGQRGAEFPSVNPPD